MTRRIALTVDNLAEAADLGRGVIDAPRPKGRNPALEVGLPSLLDLLDAVGAPAAWFVEGWNGRAHPEAVAEIARRGHDVGVHGWLHEPWARLAAGEEADLLARATGALADALGRPPSMFRAPGGPRRPTTLELLHGHEMVLDASLAPDGSTTSRPVRTREGPTWVGYEWALVDATYWLWDDLAPAAGAARLRRALDGAPAAADAVTVVILHPHITGMDPGRGAAVVDLLLEQREQGGAEFVRLSGLSGPSGPPGPSGPSGLQQRSDP